MANDEIVTAAEITEQIGGRAMVFAPLTIRAWGRVTAWVKREVVAPFLEQLNLVTDYTNRQIVIDRAMAFASRMNMFDDGLSPTGDIDDPLQVEAYEAFHRMLQSFDGIAMIILESMRCAKNKGLAYQNQEVDQELVDWVFDHCDDVGGLMNRVAEISGQAIAAGARRHGKKANPTSTNKRRRVTRKA